MSLIDFIKKFLRISGALRILNFFRSVIKNNSRKKRLFPLSVWYDKRNDIKNWQSLYFWYSSLFVDILVAIFGNTGWAQRLKIKALYTDGLILYFPLVTSRYYEILCILMSDIYLIDFESYFSRKIDFREYDVIIDIGAHVGRFCIPIFLNHRNIRVFAYEPDPNVYKCLCRNLVVNNIDRGDFRVEDVAVFNKSGRVTFSKGAISSQGGVADIGFTYERNKSMRIVVESKTLEDIFKQNKIETCKLLKIDCEGSEYAIFENTPDEILSKIENLFIEVHQIEGKDPVKFQEYIETKGFDVRGHLRPDGGLELFCVQETLIYSQ